MQEYPNRGGAAVHTSNLVASGLPEVYFARGSHVASFRRGEQQWLNVLAPFIKAGLEAGDQCIVVVEPPAGALVNRRLTELAVEVETALASGQLLLRSIRGKTGGMGALFDDVMSTAQKAGRQVIRYGGDMTSMPGETWVGGIPPDCLFHYGKAWPRSDMVGLCQFDPSLPGGSAIVDALETHPHYLIGHVLHENPFYQEGQDDPRTTHKTASELVAAHSAPLRKVSGSGALPLSTPSARNAGQGEGQVPSARELHELLVVGLAMSQGLEGEQEGVCEWACRAASSLVGGPLVAIVVAPPSHNGPGAVYGQLADSPLPASLACCIAELAESLRSTRQASGQVEMLEEPDLAPDLSRWGIGRLAWVPARTVHQRDGVLMVGLPGTSDLSRLLGAGAIRTSRPQPHAIIRSKV